MIRYVINTSS